MPPLCHAFTQHKIILLHLHSKFRYRHIFRQHVITLSLSSNNRPLKSHAYIQHANTLSRLHTTWQYKVTLSCNMPLYKMSHLPTSSRHTVSFSHNRTSHVTRHIFQQYAITLSPLHTTCHCTVTLSSHCTVTFNRHIFLLSRLHTTCHHTVTPSYNMSSHTECT